MRTIKVQVSTADNHRIGTGNETGPEQLRFTALTLLARDLDGGKLRLGPLSIESGLAIFDGDVEPQVTVTVHEGSPLKALEIWHRLRGIPGVDCGRIYDRGRSWCAKAYENTYWPLGDGRKPWPEHTFEPIECEV